MAAFERWHRVLTGWQLAVAYPWSFGLDAEPGDLRNWAGLAGAWTA